MHDTKNTYLKFAILALLCSVTISVIAGADPKNSNSKNIRPWLKRPWEWRYLIYINGGWEYQKKFEREHSEEIGPQARNRSWKPLFDATHFFQSDAEDTLPGDGISVVVIEFDKHGKVITPNAFGKPLHGRIDQNMRVTLAEGDSGVNRQFDFGHLFLGLGSASTHWAPSICLIDQVPSLFSKTDTSYLYGPKFKINGSNPTVGCREWAYQIKDSRRPYIDITNYTFKRFDHFGPGAYIRQTIGWAGFDDHKPVIGKDDNDWYCFYDCPDGDQPGIISDIESWAERNGWKAPQPPTRMPVFPDPPAKSGYYPSITAPKAAESGAHPGPDYSTCP